MNRVSAHPLELRLHVLQAIDAGATLVDVAEQFGVSLPSIRRWLRLRREQGHIAPKCPNGGRPPKYARQQREQKMKAGQQFLTRRQIEIVSLVAQGLSNAEVADHLCIDERTVRNQMHRILGDLNLKRRSQLAIFAHQAHLVSLTEVELPRAAQRALEQIRPQRSALEEVSMNAAKSTIHCHQVVIDGKVFYEGEDWASVFLAASENPEYGEIVYVEDGVPGARFGAPLHREALQCKSQS